MVSFFALLLSDILYRSDLSFLYSIFHPHHFSSICQYHVVLISACPQPPPRKHTQTHTITYFHCYDKEITRDRQKEGMYVSMCLFTSFIVKDGMCTDKKTWTNTAEKLL